MEEKNEKEINVEEGATENKTEEENIDFLDKKEKNKTISKFSLKDLKNNKKLIVGISVAVIVLLIAVVSYVIYSVKKPALVYKSIIKQSFEKLSGVMVTSVEKNNITLKTDFSVDLKMLQFNDTMVDTINKTSFILNYQMDKNDKKMLLKLDANTDSENLMNLELLLDGNKEKIYAYAKEYYDKYVSIDVSQYEIMEDLFEMTDIMFEQQLDYEELQKVLTEEFSSLIGNKDCHKVDEYYVFEITEVELNKRIKEMFNSLMNDEEFLSNFEDSDYVKSSLKEFLDGMNMMESTSNKITISTSLDGNQLDEIIINFGSYAIDFDFEENSTEFEIYLENVKFLSGYINTVVTNNLTKVEFSVDLSMIAKIKLNLEVESSDVVNIPVLDEANVKKYEDLTQEELDEIMEKFEGSSIVGDLNIQDTPTFDSDFNFDFGNLFDGLEQDTAEDIFGDIFDNVLDDDNDFDFNFGF